MRKDNSTNAENNAFLKGICPMQTAMNQLSGKWEILLLWYIHLEINRFGLIRQRLPTLTTKRLSQQLREMEQDGLITRTIYPEMPPRVEYAITEKAIYPFCCPLYHAFQPSTSLLRYTKSPQ